MDWFTKLFINQVTPALEFYSGVGSSSDDGTQMYILLDEDGNEYPAVVVEEETIFDATANDIREGKVAATEDGVTVGTKEIPAYVTREGYRIITNGSKFILSIPEYEYTKLLAVFCPFNVNLTDSVAADRVAIEDCVYPVNSTTADSIIIKDIVNTRVDFGITNESGSIYLIRYILYKEIY